MFVKVNYFGFYPLGSDVCYNDVKIMQTPWESYKSPAFRTHPVGMWTKGSFPITDHLLDGLCVSFFAVRESLIKFRFVEPSPGRRWPSVARSDEGVPFQSALFSAPAAFAFPHPPPTGAPSPRGRHCSINRNLYCRWTRERQKPGTEIFPFPAGCLFRVYFVCLRGDKRTVPCAMCYAHCAHL